jgi:hypothetical protein
MDERAEADALDNAADGDGASIHAGLSTGEQGGDDEPPGRRYILGSAGRIGRRRAG